MPTAADGLTFRPSGRSVDDGFESTDWALILTIAAIWGSSFLWVAIGLDSFGPWTVAFGRMALGCLAVWLFPAARKPVPASAWPTIVVVALFGNAGPAVLVALAQESIESSLAAMINSASPLAVLLVGLVAFGKRPGPVQVTGIAVGFVGVVAIALPNLTGANATPVGIALMVGSVAGYGISNNVVFGLQRAFGAPAVIGRALLVSSIVLAPFGLPGLVGASPSPSLSSVIALIILGVFGTGIARTLNASLIGRVGPARGSIATYLMPIVAIVLGLAIRSESVEILELIGTATVLVGAWLTSRPRR